MDKVDNPFLYTIRIPASTSPKYIITGQSLHIISILVPWFSGLELNLKFIVSLLIMLSLIAFNLRFMYFEKKSGLIELVLSSDDNWRVNFNNLSHDAEIGPDKFIHPYLCIIKLLYEEKSRFFIITPDLMSRDDYRRLRVRLRHPQHQ